MNDWLVLGDGRTGVIAEYPAIFFVLFVAFLVSCFYFFFVIKDNYELKQMAKRRRETGKLRRQRVLTLIEEFRSDAKRSNYYDEEIIFFLEDGLGLDGLFGEDLEQVDCSAFCHWLETSVYRAKTKSAIEVLKDQVNILSPNPIDSYVVDIFAHCEAFGFQLEEFEITQSELEELAKEKVIAWSNWKFEKYQSKSISLEKDWKKVVELLLERGLPNPALKDHFSHVSLPL